MNGTKEEFSSRVNEFEYLVAQVLYIAVEKYIMIYYSPMVAEVKQGPKDTTAIVILSISAIMNESATLQLDSDTAVAVYVSSLITHNEDFFAISGFNIMSLSILEKGDGGGDTIIMANNSRDVSGLSTGVLSGMVILGLIATLMALTVVFLMIYIRYGGIVRLRPDPGHNERLPLIADNDANNQGYNQINLNHKQI